jgi:hypothetical protein
LAVTRLLVTVIDVPPAATFTRPFILLIVWFPVVPGEVIVLGTESAFTPIRKEPVPSGSTSIGIFVSVPAARIWTPAAAPVTFAIKSG